MGSEMCIRDRDKLVGFLVGQLMKQSNGSVNPGMAKELLLKELED